MNCWKKNRILPNFKSRFRRANAVRSLDEVDKDLVEESGYLSKLSNSLGYIVPSHTNFGNAYSHEASGSTTNTNAIGCVPGPTTIFSQEQINQLSQLILSQTQQNAMTDSQGQGANNNADFTQGAYGGSSRDE